MAEVLTIESALEELREMFKGKGMFAPYITCGFDPDHNWRRLFTINWVSNDVGHWTDKATSLADAMDQVRAWHKEQS